MDFAKKVLQKYGWKEGDALGKNTNGITAPIKASLKFNNAGFGANPAQDLTNNWWERVYNDAAGNIAVNKQGSAGITPQPHESAIQLRQLDVDAVEISTKGYSVQKLKKKAQTAGASSRYGTNFLKASTLLGGTEREEAVANHISTEDIELAPVKTLTDEELFAACGGRTAHKGARHGLRLSGKLARIDEQNTRLLQQLESKSFETVIRSNDWQIQQSKNGRKKSKKQKRNEQRWIERGDGGSGAVNGTVHEGDDEVKDMVHHADYVVAKNRKKRKNHEQMDQELADGVISMFAELPEEDGGAVDERLQQAVAAPMSKAKKKSKTTSQKQPTMEDELDRLGGKIRKLDHSSVVIKKKDRSKKVKRKSGTDVNDADTTMADPAARYRKDYRPDAKQNNRLLKSSVPHEVPMVPVIKPKLLLRSDSSDEDEEDVVDRVNAEQSRYRKKMRATVPRINIIKPTEDECLAIGQELKERHKCEVKRVANRTASSKRKKSKRKQRQVSQLADSLSKKL
ncbi:G patch domain-containing protein 4 [Anopheles bellator]|uniref:G patch domain-containing protein 4 n=1 Tax=Anopheles bellator TaxID=139047 RepID=UPI0026488151|nr:G patch domain-containing protein 4 [Anopheles bellator]